MLGAPCIIAGAPNIYVNGQNALYINLKVVHPSTLIHAFRTSIFFPLLPCVVVSFASLCHWSFSFIVLFELLLLCSLSALRTCNFVVLFHRQGKLFVSVNGFLFHFWYCVFIWINMIRVCNRIHITHTNQLDLYESYRSCTDQVDVYGLI